MLRPLTKTLSSGIEFKKKKEWGKTFIKSLCEIHTWFQGNKIFTIFLSLYHIGILDPLPSFLHVTLYETMFINI